MVLGDVQLEVHLPNLGMCDAQLDELVLAVILGHTQRTYMRTE